ncbi:MAG: histidinol-phosphate transaminase [Gracilimonas sp.]|uniref:histidinol-phosphate transaminase n=1 Tax=Gracilimonas TaxID=649462 RepID=UPI001B25D9F2|nr:histidinol-phosphate transaminase [Gracilimonas sp.]MBO6585438.1 histidinol-phosphate transaminase [Gracilimonas sp.]MBO6616434.1 histidinol-phosphate transaminase [Gracilimonas sp.]
MSKKINIDALVRENIRNLKPYRSARDDFDRGILLDANENSMGAPFEDDLELNRYPMPYQEELREKIAAFRDVHKENVFVGVGSDEAIDLLFRVFCIPGKDRVIVNPPTYGMYKVSANINDVQVDEVLLTEGFQLQPEKILDAVQPETKIIFICSPNNPTANSMNISDVVRVLEGFNGIVVVDEAYIDFSRQGSLANNLNDFPNLVVLQTMSKSFGLAGIRLGIALANPEVISYMMKVKAPYNVNKLTSKKAIQAFSNLENITTNIKSILKERERVINKLIKYEAVDYVYPTDANFILFKIKNAMDVYKKMAEEGVIIRYRGNEPHCEDCLRLTIGTQAENDRFFEALDKIK